MSRSPERRRDAIHLAANETYRVDTISPPSAPQRLGQDLLRTEICGVRATGS